MSKFIDDEDLYVAVKHNNADARYTCTYHNDYYKSCSLIDHFLVTKTLYEYVEKCYCLFEEVDNPIVL